MLGNLNRAVKGGNLENSTFSFSTSSPLPFLKLSFKRKKNIQRKFFSKQPGERIFLVFGALVFKD